jgi:hypothetical protein
MDCLEETTDMNYFSFFERMKIIPLEDTDESLIGKVDNIKVSEDYLFILDRSKARKLLVFDKNGKYLRQIGRFGSGPTEYNGISDFTINEKEKEILVLDVKPRICIYNMDNGEFIRSILLENRNSRSSRIQYFEDKIYLNLVNYEKNADSYMLKELDYYTGEQTGKFVNEALNNKAFKSKFMIEDPYFINKSQNKPVFYRQFMDTVFAIGKQGVSPYVVLKGKNLITEEIILENNFFMQEDMFFKFTNTKIIQQIMSFEEYNDFIFLEYLEGGFYWKKLLIDKQQRQVKRLVNLDNDFIFKVHKEDYFVSTIDCITSDGAYEVFDPFGYLEFIDKDVFTTEMENFLRNLPEESNPVILYYELKK